MSTTVAGNKYERILLKISGEYLSQSNGNIIDVTTLDRLTATIKNILDLGVQVGLVIGGGNFLRGSTLESLGMDRVAGDYMGMLATLMNGIAMRDALERSDVSTRLLSAIPVAGIAQDYNYRNAMHYLQSNEVVIFAGGTSNPFFSTDSAACLRAIEIQADVVMKATLVDGIYSADPKLDTNAKIYRKIDYNTVITKQLAVMDMTAVCLARDYNLPIVVFNIDDENALQKLIQGKCVGTTVTHCKGDILE
jgi:uridylate kinase